MVVRMCRPDHRNVRYYLSMARAYGFLPFEENGWYCVEVLKYDRVYRAPDAVFDQISDGTYIFEKIQKDESREP